MSRDFKSLGTGSTVLAVDKSVIPDMSSIDPSDWSVLPFVDGVRTLDQICDELTMPDADIIASLMKFHAAGMIKASGGAAQAAPAAAQTPAQPPPKQASPLSTPPGRPRSEPRSRARPASSPSTPAQQAKPSPTPKAESAGKPAQPEKKKKKKGVPLPENWPIPWDQFTFDPMVLDQEVDIDLEKRKQIIYYAYHLERVTYYDLLQVPRDIEGRRIKKTYFRLSKEFHPDQFFRKELGTFREQVGTIFKWISTAYATLTDKRKRAQYDALLDRGLLGDWELKKRARPQNKRPQGGGANALRVSPSGTTTAPARTPPSASTNKPQLHQQKRPPSSSAMRRRNQGGSKLAQAGSATPGTWVSSGKVRAREVIKNPMGSQARTPPAQPQPNPVASGPSGGTIPAIRKPVSERSAAVKGGLLGKAERAEEEGDYDTAATHYIASLAVRFVPKAAASAARCLLELNQRLDEAEKLARKAVEAETDETHRVTAMVTLGRILFATGQTSEARIVLTEAQRLDPHDPVISSYLAQT